MRRLAEVLAFAPPDQCQRKPRLTQEGRQDDSSRRSDVRHSWYDKGLGVRRTEADGNRVSTTIGRHVWARATELRWRSMEIFRKCIVFLSFLLTLYPAVVGQPEYSIARIWNEQLLEAIRNDFARPTIHARNCSTLRLRCGMPGQLTIPWLLTISIRKRLGPQTFPKLARRPSAMRVTGFCVFASSIHPVRKNR